MYGFACVRCDLLEVGTKVPIHRHLKSSETVVCLEGGTVILEMKNGPYEPIGPQEILEI